MTRYYLAYGSNLNVTQMQYRCPGAVEVTTAMIPDYQLMFKGSKTGSYLTIERRKGAQVPVAVWSVTDADIAALDRYEGFPTFYYKREFVLDCADGKRHRCFAYIMHEDHALGIPAEWYVRTCLTGYQHFCFDRRYLQDALDFSAAGIRKKGGAA